MRDSIIYKFIFLILFVVSSQSVCADTVAKINETEYETLAAAITAANTGETIMLVADAVNSDALEISGKSITIDLQGHSVSRSLSAATANGYVIKVNSGATLTVQDTSGGGTITGGWNNSSTGGGIYSEGTLTLNGITVSGNKVNIKGGGIHINKGTATITDCTIENNKTTTNSNGYGGGIYIASGTLSITDCTIQANESENSGGGIYIAGGTVTVTNTTIKKNKAWAGSSGAGIYLNSGTLTLDGGEITENIGTKYHNPPKYPAVGFGVYYNNGTLKMKGAVKISGNIHRPDDGSNSYGDSNLYLKSGKKITVTGNMASAQIGVTLNTTSDVFTSGLSGKGDETCFTSDNSSYIVGLNGSGEAILGTPVTVSFDANGGTGTMSDMVFANGSTITLPTCTFTPPTLSIFNGWNTAADGSGTAYIDEAVTSAITSNTTLYAQWISSTSNVAKIGSDEYATLGEAVAAVPADGANPTTITLLRSVNNGDGITVSGNKNVVIDFSGYSYTVSQNYAGSSDALLINAGSTVVLQHGILTTSATTTIASSGDLTLTDMNVTGKISYGGGSITITSGQYDITWDVPSALADVAKANINISGGTFTSPVPEDYCAPDYAPKDNGDGTYTVFMPDYVCQNVDTGKKYETIDAAVSAANEGETIVLLKNVVLSSALEIPSGKNVVLDLKGYSVSRSLTKATGDGHVIKVVSGGTFTLQDTSSGTPGTVTGGWTSGNGGGIYNDGTFTFKSGVVTGNKAINSGRYGGGIYSSGGSTLTIEGGEVSNNEAAIKGGGIHISSRQVCSVSNCVIKGNKTTTTTNGWGAGLYIQRGTVTVSGCTITENDGMNQGAGVFMGADSDNPVVTITNTTISNNTSTGNGAGLYYNRGTLQMTGAVTVSGNTTNGVTNNVYLPNGKKITVTGNLSGSAIGVTLATVTDVITSGLRGNGDETCFNSDNTQYMVGLNANGEAILGTPITVSFDANGGSGTMDDITFASGSSMDLPACTFTAPSADQIFSCWTTNDDGTGTKYVDEDATTGITENTTLYAQWKVPVYVCKIKATNVEYESVAAASKAIQGATTDDKTIVLLQDCEEESRTRTDYILDLNSYTLTGNLAIADGNVVITDNSTAGTGTITGTEYVVNNQGALTIEKGTFSASQTRAVYNTGTLTVNDGVFDAASRVIENDGGTCTINGGTLTGNTMCLSNISDGNATINGGSMTASSGYAIVNQGHSAHDKTKECHLGHLYINDGTFCGAMSDIYSTDTVTINGGTFNSPVTHANATLKYSGSGLRYKVYGGKYKTYDYNIHCGIIDPDKTLSAEPINGYYEIVNREYMCEINGTQYRSIDSALRNAQQNDVITMLRDVDDGHGIRLDDPGDEGAVIVNDITIDFDGHTYEAATRAVGTGTKGKGSYWTQVLHYGRLHSLTMKNGTIKVKDGQDDYFLMYMQNYCNLILEDMTLDATNVNNEYNDVFSDCLNFRDGSSVFRGKTTILLPDVTPGEYAMSLNMGSDGNYRDGASLEILGNEVEILGNFTVLDGSGADAGLTITGGHFSDFVIRDGADKNKIAISGGTYAANSGFITDDRAIDEYCIEEYCACDHRSAKGDKPETWTVRWPVPELKDGSYAGYDRTEDKEVTSAYYTRSFSKNVTNNYQCWFVPFDYEVTEEEDEDGWEFYSINGASGLGNENVIQITKLDVGDLLEANKPYVVKPAKVETHGFASPYAKTLKAIDENCVRHIESGDTNFDFYGVYQRTYATEKNEWLTVSIMGTSFWAVPGDDVKPFRWIIKATDLATGAPAKVNFTFAEDEVSGIDSIGVTEISSNEDSEVIGIYTIDGVKRDKMMKGLNIIRMKNNKTKVVLIK